MIRGISRTYLLLAGLAIENALKGLLVAVDPSHINSGKLSKVIQSHDIPTLASKLPELKLSDAQLSLCRVLKEAIPYWGRYPIPRRHGNLTMEVPLTDVLRQDFLELFHHLGHMLYWKIRDGWDSGAGPQTIKVRSLRYGDTIDPEEPLF